MILSREEILELLAQGVVENSGPEYVNPASLDVTLGRDFMREASSGGSLLARKKIRLAAREPMEVWEGSVDEIFLYPGDFILAHTEQIFSLPLDICAEYCLKSSMARIGLEHLGAGWCDPGWHGSALTVEFKNMTQYHTIVLNAGVRCGQMKFYRINPVKEGYVGRYNGDRTVSGIKL